MRKLRHDRTLPPDPDSDDLDAHIDTAAERPEERARIRACLVAAGTSWFPGLSRDEAGERLLSRIWPMVAIRGKIVQHDTELGRMEGRIRDLVVELALFRQESQSLAWPSS